MKVFDLIYLKAKHSLKKEGFLIFILLLVSAFLFAYKLGFPSLWDESESVYTEVAREITRTGDWVTLHFNYQPWFIHPPLFMWLTALLSKLIGWSELTARIWSALFATGSAIGTYFLGKSVFNKKVGFLAALVFCSTFQTIISAHIGVMDSALSFFVLIALLFFYLGCQTKQGNYFLFFFIATALATLAKGPVGLILPLVIILPYLFLTNRFDVLKEKQLKWGLLLFILIAAPWYLAVYCQHRSEFLRYILGYQSFGRYFGAIEGQSAPWYYYFEILFVGALPWASFIPFALAHLFKIEEKAQALFLLLWCVIVFIFFSLAQTKLPNYILFIYPALAIAIAKLWVDAQAGGKRSPEMLGSFALLGLISFSVVFWAVNSFNSQLPAIYRQSASVLIPLAYITVSGALISAWLFLIKKPRASFYALVVMMVIAVWDISAGVLPEVEKYKPMKALSVKLMAIARPTDKIAEYKLSRTASFVFYTRRPVRWLDNETELQGFLRRNGGRKYIFMAEPNYRLLSRKGLVQLFARQAGTVIAVAK